MTKRFLILLWLIYSFSVLSATPKYHIMLTGASFGVPENGWFELSCSAFDAEAINKSVSGEAIYHTANRMATNTFYSAEELDRTDVFVIMHVHNQNVADSIWLVDDYNQYTMPTSNYAIAYDYVIKKYKDDCYKLKDNPASKYYGTENGKPAVIVLCTHWHDARTSYNAAIRTLAQKWNFPLVEWDKNIGFSKDVLVNGQQPSLQYAKDTEVINGVTYAWHPLRGAGQYIQKKMSSVFNAVMEQILGVILVSARVSAKSLVVLPSDSGFVNVDFTGLAPWSFSYKLNEQQHTLTNITENPLRLSFNMSEVQSIEVEPLSVSNNSVASGYVSGLASISVADKIVYPTFDAYVHQANKTTAYTTDQYVQVKTTTDNYSRECFFTFNLNAVSITDQNIIFRAYFYQNVYPANAALVENHLVEIDGNSDTYSTLTWNIKPTSMTKISETIIAPSDLTSYISWDITDWVKSQLNAGKTVATLSLKVISGGGLLYFYSTESAVNKPQIITNSLTAAGFSQNQNRNFEIYQSKNTLRIKSGVALQSLTINSINGYCILKKNGLNDTNLLFDIANIPTGLYLIETVDAEKKTGWKFIKL